MGLGIQAKQGCVGVDGCRADDATVPPTPQIAISVASAGLAAKDAQWAPNGGGNPRVGGRDPAYIELANWEPGTKIQLINTAANPGVTFDDKDSIITLEPTGRDINGRRCGVWIDAKQMKDLELESGHSYELRVIDAEGNVSEAVKGRLEGRNYQAGNQGRVYEPQANQWADAAQISLLDGESRRTVLLKKLQDSTAPKTERFQKQLKLTGDDKGNVTMSADRALEPEARVSIMNGRTGTVFNGAATLDRNISMPLAGIANGDTLFFTVSDRDGNAAEKFEVRYSDKCKDGRASSLGIIAARLDPVIQ